MNELKFLTILGKKSSKGKRTCCCIQRDWRSKTWSELFSTYILHARFQIGDRGTGPPPPPLANHKNIGFLGNIVPDPLKNHKATKPAFNVGPMMAR